MSRVQTHQSIDPDLLPTLASNHKLQGIHEGERCFIIGTGPSIATQELSPLKDELCITLNQFYVHKDFSKIDPTYHLLTGLAVHPRISPAIGLEWFKELEEKVTNSTIFLNYEDRDFVLRNELLRDRMVHYVSLDGDYKLLPREGIDATKKLYPAQNSSILAIQLALYMGFRQIFLLGLDHDWILRYSERLSTHFYKPIDTVLERSGLTEWDVTNWGKQFWLNWNLWEEYSMVKDYAEAHDVRILNATAGGLLDVFERVDYKSLFR